MIENLAVRAKKAEAKLEALSGSLREIEVALATIFPQSTESSFASNLPLELRAQLVAVDLRSRGAWWIERSQRIEIERDQLRKDVDFTIRELSERSQLSGDARSDLRALVSEAIVRGVVNEARAENEKLRGEIASSAEKDACGDRMVQRRDDRITELIEENNALKMNAIEQSEVYAQAVQDLALALGVELSPCSSGCPGHLPAEGVAKLKRLRAEKESEGSVPQFVKDAANLFGIPVQFRDDIQPGIYRFDPTDFRLVAVLNHEDSAGAPSFTVAFDLWDGES